MEYDVIALDLDGTSLSSSNEVQRSTYDAVQWARSRGVHVVVATGRIRGEAKEFAEKMGTDDLMVTSGGAIVCSGATGEVFHQISIPWESASRAAAISEALNLSTMVYADGNLLVTPYSETIFGAYKTNEGYLATRKIVPSVAEYLAENHIAADKLFSRCAFPDVLHQARHQLEQLPFLRVLSSASDNIEVIAPNADKGRALDFVCQRLGSSLSRAIAIGDSENDLEMLAAVGMPVAMQNADPQVKAIAKYITTDNNHGGVAQAIHHLLGE